MSLKCLFQPKIENLGFLAYCILVNIGLCSGIIYFQKQNWVNWGIDYDLELYNFLMEPLLLLNLSWLMPKYSLHRITNLLNYQKPFVNEVKLILLTLWQIKALKILSLIERKTFKSALFSFQESHLRLFKFNQIIYYLILIVISIIFCYYRQPKICIKEDLLPFSSYFSNFFLPF